MGNFLSSPAPRSYTHEPDLRLVCRRLEFPCYSGVLFCQPRLCSRLWRVWLWLGSEQPQHDVWGLRSLLSENIGVLRLWARTDPHCPIRAAWGQPDPRPTARLWADGACLPNTQFSRRVRPSASSGSHCSPSWLACRETRGRMLGSSRPCRMRVLGYQRWRKGRHGS